MSGLERLEKWAVVLAAVAALVALFRVDDSIRNDTEALQLRQRPRIAVSALALDQEPIDGQMINVHVSLSNQGRSPAVGVIAKVRLALNRNTVDDWDAVTGRSYDMVFPDTTAHGFDASVLIGPGTMAPYHRGHLRIWISGRITYSDVSGRRHWMTFCAHHAPAQNLTQFSRCDTGNDLDPER